MVFRAENRKYFPNDSAKDIHSTFETVSRQRNCIQFPVGPRQTQVYDNFDKAKYIVVSFDESLNHTTQLSNGPSVKVLG